MTGDRECILAQWLAYNLDSSVHSICTAYPYSAYQLYDLAHPSLPTSPPPHLPSPSTPFWQGAQHLSCAWINSLTSLTSNHIQQPKARKMNRSEKRTWYLPQSYPARQVTDKVRRTGSLVLCDVPASLARRLFSHAMVVARNSTYERRKVRLLSTSSLISRAAAFAQRCLGR